MNKGEIVFSQVVGVIVGVAVLFILLLFSSKLFSPTFDRGDEIAKSYLKTFKEEIKVADNGDIGEFFMWDIGDEKEFYLVYFGNAIETDFNKGGGGNSIVEREETLEGTKVQFNSFGSFSNRMCICSVEGFKSICDYCYDLKYPVIFSEKYSSGGTWYDDGGSIINIKFLGGKYVFSYI